MRSIGSACSCVLVTALLVSVVVLGPDCLHGNSRPKEEFKKSDLILMFQENNLQVLRQYNVDIVAWGNQFVRSDIGEIVKRRHFFEDVRKSGIRYHAIDFALLQEGERYLAHSINRGELGDISQRRMSIEEIDKLKRIAVVDINGDFVGVPWVQARIMPMACVNDPGYRRWLFSRVDVLMQTRPDILHFDEPLMGSYGMGARNPGCYCRKCIELFRQYLRKRPKEVWQKYKIGSLDRFDYGDFIRRNNYSPNSAPLWDEFERFQVQNAYKLLGELINHARQRASRGLLISMNQSPLVWYAPYLLRSSDMLAVELSHNVRSHVVADDPILAYKMGAYFKKPVYSTALGNDWDQIISSNDSSLVSAWIAQAYAFGNQMMMPHGFWSSKGKYVPKTRTYMCLSKWIKEVAHLLDGYEDITNAALVIGSTALQNEERKRTIQQLTSLLLGESVLFKVVVISDPLDYNGHLYEEFRNESLIVFGVPNCIDAKVRQSIRRGSNGIVWEATAQEIRKGLPLQMMRSVRVKHGTLIYVVPKRRSETGEKPKYAVHLLNRERSLSGNGLVVKGPFTVVLDERLFSPSLITRAVLHQPILTTFSAGRVDKETILKVKRINNSIEIDIPKLDVWAIIELS